MAASFSGESGGANGVQAKQREKDLVQDALSRIPFCAEHSMFLVRKLGV
jgi:hypothetical protein